MRSILLFLSLFAILSEFTLADEPLTLTRAITLALENNPDMEVTRQRLIAAEGRRIEAGKWSNPEIEAIIEEAPFDGGIARGKQLGGVTQEIPFPGKKKLDRQISQSGVEISERELLSARQALIWEVKVTFFEAISLERRHAIAIEVMSLARESSEGVTKRLEAGRGAVQDQLRAEIEAERTAAEVETVSQERTAVRQALAVLLGSEALSQRAIVGNLETMVDPGLARLASQQDSPNLIAEHPRLAAAQVATNRAALKLERERIERMPNLTVGLEVGRDGTEGESIFGMMFSLPLPLVNRGKGAIQEAGAELRIAESEFRAVELDLLTQLSSSFYRYVTASSQVDTYRQRILPKAMEAVRLADTGFQEGKFTLTDLLDTQRTAASTRLTYEEKLLELLKAQAQIEALIDRSDHSE